MRKVLAIVTGIAAAWPIGFVVNALIPPPAVVTDGDTRVTITLFLCAVITGYIARTKGWLYGALMTFLSYVVATMIGVGYILYSLSQLKLPGTTNMSLIDIIKELAKTPPQGSITEFLSEMVFKVFLPAILIGLIGGALGERIYHYRSRK